MANAKKYELEWIPLVQESINDLEDHYFYLVADKRFGTPMKAKYHKECCGGFELYSVNIGEGKTVDCAYIYDWEFGEPDCPITHYMKMPDLPWEEDKTDGKR